MVNLDKNKPCAATPPESLREHLMNPNVPKSELAWYAARELKEAERANESLRARTEKLETALKEIATGDEAGFGAWFVDTALFALEANDD